MANVPSRIDPTLYLPPRSMLRCCLEPSWQIQVYRLTSDDIKDYLVKKLDKFVPGAKVEVQPRYTENRFFAKKKRETSQTQSTTTQSYASLLVALSADTIDKSKSDQAYRWIVESSREIRMIDTVYTSLIKKYRYNREELKAILKDYAMLDHLKERFGMTEEYIQNLISLYTPMRQPGNRGTDGWVIFAASAEKIIEDMLTEVTVWEPKPGLANPIDPAAPTLSIIPGPSPSGSLEIVKVNRISDSTVEFVVYLHVGEFRATDNPELRKLFDSFK